MCLSLLSILAVQVYAMARQIGKPFEAMLVREIDTHNICRFLPRPISLGLLLAGLACLSAWSGAARADFIPSFPNAPGVSESPTVLDITSYVLEVKYDGSSNFTVASQVDNAVFLNDDSAPIYDISGTSDLSIAMTINPANGAPTGGSLSITGDAYGGSTGKLLTGTISQFGFANPTQGAADHGAEIFEFIFNTTGGDLASYYPSIVVNLSEVDINFNGTFGSTSFDDLSGNAQTDTYAGPAAPEPASLTLGCIGVLALMARFGILRGTRMLCGSPRG
jgi:hypothetical protein